MVKTNIQTFTGEVEILSNLHVGPSGSSYLTANGAASNVLDITGNVGATFFVGDGGFLSNIATTLSDIVNQGNVSANVLQFNSTSDYAGVGLVTSSNVGIQNTAPSHTLSIGDKIRVDDNTVETSGQSVIQVDGRILATRFQGDGGLLSNIATTFESIVNQGNVASNVVKFSSDSAYAGAGVITDSNVGIQNTAPTHNLSVGSNLHVNDTGSNVLTVHGNVVASNLNLGVFSITPAYGLNDVCNTSNGTSNVVQFQNATTSLVATSNITVGGNVTAQQLISTSNTEVGDRLKFSGSNVFVDTLRVADVAANIVTYDRATGELLDSSGTFMNKFAVVSEQPPSDLFANATTVTNHGGYTLTTSNLATNSNTYNAFDGTANAWTGGTGMYIGGSNVLIETNLTQLSNLHPTQFGDWLAIEFPYKTTLRHMKLTPATVWQSFPYAANLYATNNDLTWTEIKYWDGLNPGSASNVQTITVNATEQFKKYALVTTKLVPNTNIASAVAIKDWQLFTESFSIDGGKVAMAQQAATGGETVMNQHGPHSRLPKTQAIVEHPIMHIDQTAERPYLWTLNNGNSSNISVKAGYTVTASTVYNSNLGHFDVSRLYDGHPDGNDGIYYCSGGTAGNGISYSSTSGLYRDTTTSGGFSGYGGTAITTTVSGVSKNGEWLGIETPHPIVLKHVILFANGTAIYSHGTPHKGVFAGSHDGVTWESISTFDNFMAGTSSRNVTANPLGPHKLDVNSTTAYKYHRMIVEAIQTTYGNAGGGAYLIIDELRWHGCNDNPPLGDTSVDTTFTSIMNTPQTTGANVYVDGSLGGNANTNRVVGPAAANTAATYDTTGKYWELNGTLTSNISVEANTFLEGDAPHSLSMWFNSSNLVSNASNSCIFSLGTEERLDHVSAAFSNTYQTVQKIMASDDEQYDVFGWYKTVSMSNDGNHILIGAPGNNSANDEKGAAYYFLKSGTTWSEQQILQPSDPLIDTNFGVSVAISGNGLYAAIGRCDTEYTNQANNAVYIFKLESGSWVQKQKLGLPSGFHATASRFGTDVSLTTAGDCLIVGTGTYSGSNAPGGAVVYNRTNESWVQESALLSGSTTTDDEMGVSAEISGDGNYAIVGAWRDDDDGAQSGTAHIFKRASATTWDSGFKITGTDTTAGDRFGYSVSIDSTGTYAVVGAYYHGSGTPGAAYVFHRSGSTNSWSQQQDLVPTDIASSGAWYGEVVTISPDGLTALIGSRDPTVDVGAGGVHRWTRSGSTWTEQHTFRSSDGAYDDRFGSAIGCSSDASYFVAGALQNDDGGTSSGSAYIFTRDTTHHLITDLKLQSNTWHNLTYAYQGEGGSRVTYLDGRKVAEDQAEDTFGDYPPFAMTGYSQGGYVVSASEEYSANYGAYNAFNNDTNTSLDNNYYSSKAAAYSTNFGSDDHGANVRHPTTHVGGTNYKGVWLQLEMPHRLKMGFIMWQPRAVGGMPRDGVVAGSNDGVNWYRIYVFNDIPTAANVNPPGFFITPNGSISRIAYKYIRIVVTNGGGDQYLSAQNVQLYGHRENDLVRLPDPTNVLKYPHVAMTGPGQRGYVASESSTHKPNGIPRPAHQAFNGVTNDDGWGSFDNGYFNTTGLIDGAPTHPEVSEAGEWIQIQLPHKLLLDNFTLSVGTENGTDRDQARYPKEFKLYGYDGSSWAQIGSDYSTAKQTSGGQVTTYDVTTTTYYYKFLIIIKKTWSITGEFNNLSSFTQIGEWELYGTEENSSIPLQIGGGNIDKVANFRVYDKFVGEDQALEIWDAQKDEFGRAKSSMTLQKGRLGIGTDEPQGRLAVADEPDATTYGFQEFPPKPLVGYKTHFEGHGEFCASASEEYTTTGNGSAFSAFDKNEEEWQTSTGSFSSGALAGTGLTTITNGIGAGPWVQLELPYKILLKRWAIQARTTQQSRHLKSAILVGSNDGNTWDTIQTVTGQPSQTTLHYRYYDVSSNNKYHKYLRLVITEVNGGDRPEVNELKFFGYREQLPPKQSVLHDGQLTLTKNLTVPRIGPALDADDTPRRDRLVVEYNTSTNPTFEGAVRDTSGRGNDITMYGATYDASDKSIDMDGNTPASASTEYLSVDLNINESGDIRHSSSVWYKSASGSNSTWRAIFELSENPRGGGHNMALYLKGSNENKLLYSSGNHDSYTGELSGLYNIWNHIVLTYDGANKRIYRNGELILTQANSTFEGLVKNPTLSFCKINHANNNEGFNGRVSNFKLYYNHALTTEEVKTLYDMGRCDEGHHVVNFSKTRVGIGLGDGEAPTYTLDVRGQIRSRGSLVTSFTGQHKCIPDEPMEKGLIVSAKKNQFVKLNGLAIGKSAITIDESLPIVSLSNVVQDKACFGVVSATEEANTTFRVETTNGGVISTIPKTLGDNRTIVNSVGEGAIWVVDTNGPLESGDYITTSNVVGYGQKQDDDILHNYTVAKITMDCDFTGSNVAVQTIKREDTGLRTIMEDTWNQLVDYDRSSNTETQYSNTLAPSAYSDEPGYKPREVTTIVDYTDGSNLVSIAEWSNLESNIQNTYQSNTFTEIMDYTKFVSFSEWSNLTTDVQNTYSEAEITTYYQIQRGENVLDDNGQLQFEDKTGATEAPYERRFLDASGAQTDSANAVHIAAFVGCTYHCG